MEKISDPELMRRAQIGQLVAIGRPSRYLPYGLLALAFIGFSPPLAWPHIAAILIVYTAGTLWLDHVRRSFSRAPETRRAEEWGRRYVAGCTLTGIAWGLLAWFGIDLGDPPRLAILVLLLGAIGTGNVVTRAVHLPSFYAFFCAMLIPLALRFVAGALESGDMKWLLVAVGIGFGAAVLATSAHALAAREDEALRLADDNRRLIAALQTARAETEAKYRRTLEALAHAQRLGAMGSWEWEVRTGRVYWSDQLFRLFGAEPGSVTPSFAALENFLTPEERAAARRYFGALLRGGLNTARYEYHPRIAGEWRIFEETTEAVRDAGGRTIVLRGLVRDITVQRAYERALIEAKTAADLASKAKTAFLANMSHELRTPLNAVIGFSEMIDGIVKTGTRTEKLAEYAGYIRQSGGHLLGLIDDLLDMARIEAEAVPLSLEPIDMPILAAEAIEIVRGAYRDQTVTVLADIAPDAAPLEADAQRLRQVLVILLTNAVKFSKPGGTVTLSAAGAGETVHLQVADQGSGIAPGELERIFEPFRQLQPVYARAQGGAGLGLAIARALVTRHHGRIWAESEVGRGTVMHVRLPRRQTAEKKMA